MRTTIEIDASPYERSHAKAPRGYGSWAFSTQPNPRDVLTDVVFTPAMTYADAKVWIKAWVRDEQVRGSIPRDRYICLYAQP